VAGGRSQRLINGAPRSVENHSPRFGFALSKNVSGEVSLLSSKLLLLPAPTSFSAQMIEL
jgi:hypothetical protein